MVQSARVRMGDVRSTGMVVYNCYIGTILPTIARPSAHQSGCIAAVRMSHSHHQPTQHFRRCPAYPHRFTPPRTKSCPWLPRCRPFRPIMPPPPPRATETPTQTLRPIATKCVQVRDCLHASVFITGHHTLLTVPPPCFTVIAPGRSGRIETQQSMTTFTDFCSARIQQVTAQYAVTWPKACLSQFSDALGSAKSTQLAWHKD